MNKTVLIALALVNMSTPAMAGAQQTVEARVANIATMEGDTYLGTTWDAEGGHYWAKIKSNKPPYGKESMYLRARYCGHDFSRYGVKRKAPRYNGPKFVIEMNGVHREVCK